MVKSQMMLAKDHNKVNKKNSFTNISGYHKLSILLIRSQGINEAEGFLEKGIWGIIWKESNTSNISQPTT
jgi:hypothetical protein